MQVSDAVGVLWAVTSMQWLASKDTTSYFRGYGIDRLSNRIKRPESHDLSNPFKTHSRKQEESPRVN